MRLVRALLTYRTLRAQQRAFQLRTRRRSLWWCAWQYAERS